MLYLQRHRNRRWCHHSCGHRARQAAYYRRMRSAHDPGLRLSDTSHNQL
jgi:predicted RNA-binding Zn ribbon-like protein